MYIAIEGLTKVYKGDIKALKGIQLTIPNGMFGLLGPNGAGKTTLMRIMAGILHPSSGKVMIGNYDGSTEKGRTEIKRILGYLPQDLGMYTDLSAYEFLNYVGILKGMDNKKLRRERIAELLELVSLSDVAQRKIKTFSGGMKRRVGIAQALLNDPRLLIVDEPTAGLDPEERIRFRNLLAGLGGDRTILLSTHIVEDIAQTCRQLAVMQSGQVIFQGTITQMLQETRGKVWLVETQDKKPEGNFTIVSVQNMGNVMQYRVVGLLPPHVRATFIEPTLEDAYVWLMRGQQSPSQVISPNYTA
ncbi:MAG: ABC transporter ATP-binding protein [Ktedonobacteraceae bacterium]|nr:ABC transporter ATP-binding protein [Ktedonobacteraceae bacterium]MBV9713538.1 ABC transporter ATP-binding protein [Ktedonobacteraceae bacterium]